MQQTSKGPVQQEYLFKINMLNTVCKRKEIVADAKENQK